MRQLSETSSEPTAVRSEMGMSLDASLRAGLLPFLIVALGAWLTLVWLVDRWIAPSGLSDSWVALELLTGDVTGIIKAQLAFTVAILFYATVQARAAVAERRALHGHSLQGSAAARLAGLPAGWLRPEVIALLRQRAVWREELLHQHYECRMLLVRYAAFGLPISGFIGTVIGIKQAVSPLDELIATGRAGELFVEGLSTVVAGIEIAFDTTLSGLALALIATLTQLISGHVLRSCHVEIRESTAVGRDE